MGRSDWYLTGDCLKFDADGVLRDGQNRLRSSVTSGVPFLTHVVFAIPPEAFDVLDSGTVRIRRIRSRWPACPIRNSPERPRGGW